METLSELVFNKKKLSEAETQLKSLTLILGKNNSQSRHGMDLTVLEQNRKVLQDRVEELRDCVSNKERELASKGNTWQSCLSKPKENDCSNVSGNSVCKGELDRVCNLTMDTSEITGNLDELLDSSNSSDVSDTGLDALEVVSCEESSLTDYLKEQNTRLRRCLSETRQKHKKERNRVIEQLRMLEIEAMDGERNWTMEMREKQIKIEELVNRNQELLIKSKELTTRCRTSDELRKRESEKIETNARKNEVIISRLQEEVANTNVEKENLEEKLKFFERKVEEADERVRLLSETKQQLERKLCNKNDLFSETEKKLEKSSKETKQTKIGLEILLKELDCLKEDKNYFGEHLRTLITTVEENVRQSEGEECKERERLLQKRCSPHVNLCSVKEVNGEGIDKERSSQLLRDVMDCVQCLKEQEVETRRELVTVKERLLQKQRENDILKQNKSPDAHSGNPEKNARTHTSDLRRRLCCKPDNVQRIMDVIKKELGCLQEDMTRHKENVETLRDRWRHYKTSVEKIHQDLIKKK